jgi:hypothetical protein
MLPPTTIVALSGDTATDATDAGSGSVVPPHAATANIREPQQPARMRLPHRRAAGLLLIPTDGKRMSST